MPVHHDREVLLGIVRSLPAKMLEDGILLDCPKRRRREQAMNLRPMTIKLPPEQKRRLATQINRFIELCGKDLGIEILLKLIEEPSNELVRSWVET